MFSITLTSHGKETIIKENLTMSDVLDIVSIYDGVNFIQLAAWLLDASNCERPMMKYYWQSGIDEDCIIYWKP